MTLPTELQTLAEALAANERDARQLIEGLSDADARWRPAPGSWSVAECLDHLAVSNRVYVSPMQLAAERAKREGRQRRRPALPGVLGGLFVKSLEPPATRKMRAPRRIIPREAPSLADATAAFFTAHEQVVQFLRTYADIDLAGVHFPNPFIRGLRWSLATGLHALATHERRHLWQAWNVRRAQGRQSILS